MFWSVITDVYVIDNVIRSFSYFYIIIKVTPDYCRKIEISRKHINKEEKSSMFL